MELRKRTRIFLEKSFLLDDLKYNNPIKFSGFLYPDDFSEYTGFPSWSRYGENMDFKDWNKLREHVFSLYKIVNN